MTTVRGLAACNDIQRLSMSMKEKEIDSPLPGCSSQTFRTWSRILRRLPSDWPFTPLAERARPQPRFEGL